MTDTETIALTHIEFRAELPCEHPGHNVAIDSRGYAGHQGGSVEWDYEYRCPCGARARRLVCQGFRAFVTARGIRCSKCGGMWVATEVASFRPIPEAQP